MALSPTRSLNEIVVHAQYADISTAGSAFAVAVRKGYITRVYAVITNAITVADSGVTVEVNGTAITGCSLAIAYSGSAGGDTFSDEMEAVLIDETNYVNDGDTIEFVVDGNSTTTCITDFYAVIRGA